MNTNKMNLNEKQFHQLFSGTFPNVVVSEDTVFHYFTNHRNRSLDGFYDYVLKNGLVEEII